MTKPPAPTDLGAAGRRVLEIEARAIQELVPRIGAEFEQACRLCLDCAGRIVVTGMGKSGHIAYRRWVADFSRTPEVDWQSYLNTNLLAQGRRELDMQHATQAAIHQAKIQYEENKQAAEARSIINNRFYRSPSAVEYPKTN